MKLKIAILALALLIPVAARADEDETALARARYAAVEKAAAKAAAKAMVIKRDLQGYSLEGGELTAYFQKGVPLKMVAKHYGETGKTTDELYFWQGRLFFVLSTRESYNHSLNNADTPVKVVSRGQMRYYFKDGKLWRWIDEEGRTIKRGAEFKTHEKEQLSFAREMLAGARGKSKAIEAR